MAWATPRECKPSGKFPPGDAVLIVEPRKGRVEGLGAFLTPVLAESAQARIGAVPHIISHFLHLLAQFQGDFRIAGQRHGHGGLGDAQGLGNLFLGYGRLAHRGKINDSILRPILQ